MRIEYGHTPNVLLLGNGINRAYNFASWDGLIESIQTKELTLEEKAGVKRMPYPLQPVVLTDDHLNRKMKELSEVLTELEPAFEETELLRDFLELPFDSILTTNYTYEMEKSINSDFRCFPGRACKFRKNDNINAGKFPSKLLHTYFKPKEGSPIIWHIHGEAARPDTMVLGHYYYGKLISQIQSYIPKLQARYRGNKSRNQGMFCTSWVDYFMLGNVYIVGLGMELSEMDLWWMVNCKKRNFPETKIVLYKPDITTEQRLLAEAYGIIVKTDGLDGKDYKGYYKFICSKLTEELQT